MNITILKWKTCHFDYSWLNDVGKQLNESYISSINPDHMMFNALYHMAGEYSNRLFYSLLIVTFLFLIFLYREQLLDWMMKDYEGNTIKKLKLRKKIIYYYEVIMFGFLLLALAISLLLSKLGLYIVLKF